MTAPTKFRAGEKTPIQDVRTKPLRVMPDERGWLMEILRADDTELFRKFGQVYVSATYPGVVKAWHYHKVQVDYFACVAGMVKLVLDRHARRVADAAARSTNFSSATLNPVLVRSQPRLPRVEVHQRGAVAGGQRAHRAVQPRGSRRVPPRSPRQLAYDWTRKDG